MQWFGYDVMTCKVVTKDKLNEIEQGKENAQPSLSLNVIGKYFRTSTTSVQQLNKKYKELPKTLQTN